MSLFAMKSEFDRLKTKAYKETDFSENPGYFGSIGSFFTSIAASMRFIFTEKENIVFALLQWATIALVYFIWTQGLSWIPEEIWKNDTGNTAANLILLVWSLACVGLAAFPLGILTACMNASCLLRFQNKESTFTDCLKMAFSRIGRQVFAQRLEDIRLAVSGAVSAGYPQIRLSVSIGCVYRRTAESDMLLRTDAMLYEAKKEKNCVRLG